MSKKALDLTKYTGDRVGLIGLNTEFKLCHIPFIVADDVCGAMALQGSSGTGKTTLGKKLGQLHQKATGGTWGVYSADKARYEDFVGCPIPDPQTGEMKIYPMPNSITTKSLIVIDEINRATYENQEKWLSLIATREVDGFKSKARYIFTAMNPVMSTNNEDIYEGVQPLDKALGERMLGLIDIPSLGKMTDPAQRKEILKCSLNQTRWEPNDELVELHVAFIDRAKEIYEEAKIYFIEQVAEYVDSIQQELRKQTKNALNIEARRAQFIFVNILATYAIDAVTKGTTVEVLQSAAKTALFSSFPNTLWEQPVPMPQLAAAHKDACKSLTISLETLKSGAMNNSDLEKAIREVANLVEKGGNLEQISKHIFQSIPPKEVNAFSHYAYMISVPLGLSKRDPKTLMKEQEYSRFENYYDKVTNSKEYLKYKNLIKDMKKTNNKVQFIKDKYPRYVYVGAESDEDLVNFVSILESDVSWIALAILEIEQNSLEIKTHDELFTFINSMLEGSTEFEKIRAMYEDRQSA